MPWIFFIYFIAFCVSSLWDHYDWVQQDARVPVGCLYFYNKGAVPTRMHHSLMVSKAGLCPTVRYCHCLMLHIYICFLLNWFEILYFYLVPLFRSLWIIIEKAFSFLYCPSMPASLLTDFAFKVYIVFNGSIKWQIGVSTCWYATAIFS